MKLSMWMIANRLSALEPELHIRDQAPITLRSARRAYATNCVHVFQVGSDVICNGEGDYIRLKDMTASQAFEIIQCIFDFYDDWSTDIIDALNQMDFQKVVDESWYIFHNPVLLMDANYKALAMSTQYGVDEINKEWRHISEYGYLSFTGFHRLRSEEQTKGITLGDVQILHGEGNHFETDWMHVVLADEGSILGSLHVLEYSRKFNVGDVQLLQFLKNLLIPSLSRINEKNIRFSSRSVFWELMQRQWISHETLEKQLEYMGWDEEDSYRVYLIKERKAYRESSMPLVRNLISSYMPQTAVILCGDKVLIVANEKILKETQVRIISADILNQKEIYAGVSLAVKGIHNLNACLMQAEAALKYGIEAKPEQNYFYFYHYAIPFMIESADPEQTLKACQPDIVRLWENKDDGPGGRLEILRCYLENERSLVKTANVLFVHRNTLVYRVRRLLEEIEGDLEDNYTRDYMKLSLYVLETLSKKE